MIQTTKLFPLLACTVLCAASGSALAADLVISANRTTTVNPAGEGVLSGESVTVNNGVSLAIAGLGPAINNTLAALTVNNNGTITADFATNPPAIGSATGTTLTVNNSATGIIGNALTSVAIGGFIATPNVVVNNQGLITSSASAIMSLGGTCAITNSGSITVGSVAVFCGGATTIDNSGSITSTGDIAIFMLGAGSSVVNTGTITRTGGGVVIQMNNIGTLTLGTGSVIGGDILGFAGLQTLILDGTGTEDATVTNFDMLTVNAAADWDLTGAVDATTSSDINGALAMNGTLTSAAVSVNSGGTLSGTGTVIGNIAALSGGHIAPGNSIGTLNVTGNVSFAPGSVYDVEINAAGQSDLIAATGTATLTGGTVNVISGGSYVENSPYTILTAAGGVTGTFDNVVDDLPFITSTLNYDANNVTLTLGDNGQPNSIVAQTPNQANVATALDAADAQNQLDGVITAYRGLNTADARSALERLSGDVYASQALAVHTQQSAFLHTLGRQAQRGTPTPVQVASMNDLAPAAGGISPERGTVWMEGSGGTHRIRDDNAGTLRTRSGGVLIGANRILDDDLTVGAAVGMDALSGDSSRAAKTTGNVYQAGVYALQDIGPLTLTGIASAGYTTADVDRNVIIGGAGGFTRGETDGILLGSEVKLSYAEKLPSGLTATPYVSLSYTRYRQDGFTETGTLEPALRIEDATTQSLRSTAGMQFSAPIAPRAKMRWGAAWEHEFKPEGTLIRSRFVSAPAAGFAAKGANAANNRLRLDLGIEGELTTGLTLGVSYDGAFATDESQHLGIANLKWTW